MFANHKRFRGRVYLNTLAALNELNAAFKPLVTMYSISACPIIRRVVSDYAKIDIIHRQEVLLYHVSPPEVVYEMIVIDFH